MSDSKLGRRVPTDFTHVEQYPARRTLLETVAHVERLLLPPDPAKYQRIYDQGAEGACVGFGESLLMSILNRRVYAARWLYQEAQKVDEWPETPPEDGTSLRAGFDVLRDKGHRELWGSWWMLPISRANGIIDVNRWLKTTDEGRTAISVGSPCVDGVYWFEGFYADKLLPRVIIADGKKTIEYWIPPRDTWGKIVGGHCICRPGASDKRQAFSWLNSWGKSYPWPVFIDYEDHEYLLSLDGESAIVSDR